MFEYINGKIIELNPTYVVIETADIGYFINISLTTYTDLQNEKQDKTKLYLHQIIREDLHSLFGFSHKQERDIFRLLISVSGIGANTARMMLSSLKPEDIKNAIITGDVNLLKSVKGIGLKTAQRTIVDLKDKIGKAGETSTGLPQTSEMRDEAITALVMLGFGKQAVEKTVNKILKQNHGIGVEDLIKKSLKQL